MSDIINDRHGSCLHCSPGSHEIQGNVTNHYISQKTTGLAQMEPSLQVKTQLLWSVNSLKGWKCHLGDRIWTVRASCLGQNCVKVLNLIFEGENLCAAYKKFLKYSLKLPENHYFIPELNQFHLHYFLLTADRLPITRSICQILAFEKKKNVFFVLHNFPHGNKSYISVGGRDWILHGNLLKR